MTEENSKIYRDELDRLIRDRFDNGIIDYLTKVKIEKNLYDEDIEALTGVMVTDSDAVKLDNLSGLEVMRIIELCSDEDATTDVVARYKADEHAERLGNKLGMMLDLFNIHDEASLDSLLDKAIEVRNAINQAMSEPPIDDRPQADGMDNKGCECGCSRDSRESENMHPKRKERHGKARRNFREGRCNGTEQNCAGNKTDDGDCKCAGFKVSSHYDSETMDEPETEARELTRDECLKELHDFFSTELGLPLF